jgi:hypothetical protein
MSSSSADPICVLHVDDDPDLADLSRSLSKLRTTG